MMQTFWIIMAVYFLIHMLWAMRVDRRLDALEKRK